MAKSSFIGDLVIPISSASGGEEGQLRYNDATGALQVHNGTAWITNGAASGEWFKKIAQSGSATVTQATTADDTLQIAAVGDLIIGQGAKSLIFENTQSEPDRCCSISGGYAYTSDYRKKDINDVDFTDTKSVHLRAGEHTLGVLGTEIYSGLNITADAGAVLVLKDGITLENCNINVPIITMVTGNNQVELKDFVSITCNAIHDISFLITEISESFNKPFTHIDIHCINYFNVVTDILGGITTIHAMNNKYSLEYMNGDNTRFNMHSGRLEIHGLHYRSALLNTFITASGWCQISLIDCKILSNIQQIYLGGSDYQTIKIALRNCLMDVGAAPYCINNASGQQQLLMSIGTYSNASNTGTALNCAVGAWQVDNDIQMFD